MAKASTNIAVGLMIGAVSFAGPAAAQDAGAAAPLAQPDAVSGGVLPTFGQRETPAETAGISDAALPLPGFLAAGGAFDAQDPDLVITIGGGVSVSPAYFGSDEYETGGYGIGRIDFLRFPNGFEYGSGRAVGFREGLGLRGSVRYISHRNSSNYEDLSGLDNVPWAFEAGLGLGYEQRNYRVFGDVRYGVIGTNAWVGDLGADAIAYPIEGLTVTLGPRLGFGSNRFADTYFGVDAGEASASTSGLTEFDAEGGLLSGGVLLDVRYLFNERWGLEGSASWDRLLNDAADSPITELGSEDQYEVRFGITRRISLDF